MPTGLVTSLVLTAHPSSLRLGRQAALAWMQFAPRGYDKDTTLLLVTELLAAAVERCAGPLVLTVATVEDRMRVEVAITGPVDPEPEPGAVDRLEDQRWRLKMVTVLADRWGIEIRLVDEAAASRVLWFECRPVASDALGRSKTP